MASRSRGRRPAKSPEGVDPDRVKTLLNKGSETARNEHLSAAVEADAAISREWDRANLELLESGLSQALVELGDNSRQAAVTVLETFLKFIDTVPEWNQKNLHVPIWTFLAALKDLDNGRVGSMLSPNPTVHNRKPDALVRQVIRAYAVACVNILVRLGFSVTEACRIVAQQLKRQNIAIGNRVGTPPWKTVNGWRNRRSKLSPNDTFREILDGLEPKIGRLRFLSREEAKEFVAGQLRELIQNLGKTALE